MNSKLEYRIARLEKLIARKNEARVEYSPEEQTAVEAIIKVKDAIKYAQDACRYVIDSDENWSGFNWEHIARDLDIADSYLQNQILNLL